MNSKCIVIGALATFLAGLTAMAGQLNQARVSEVIRDVRLLPSNAAPRPAAVNDNIIEGTAVRTGVESRTELTFSDQTITRLGQNTVFSFRGNSREVRLDSGAVLMQVPQGGSAVQIRTAAVTASITGGTGLMSSNKGYLTKLLILEGSGQFCTNGGDCITLHGGEMALEMNGHFVGPLKFDVKLVFTTSHLVTDFSPLPNEPLIFQVIDQQERQSEPPPPPPGKDELDVTDQRTSAFPSPPIPTATPSVTPSATPSKFGTPSVIASPNPYVIRSGTTITTDPSITTDGVTDFGKVYRGSSIDGPFSAWAFGSTSSFDTTSDFDGDMNNSGAVFKFGALELTGDPTIDTSGGETRLGLIGVNGISSSGPGGTLTFPGISDLLLATQNGSINLGPEISFRGFHALAIYARGDGSNLTLGAPIDVTNLRLYSQGDIQINGAETVADTFFAFAGGDFLSPTADITATNIDIQSLGNITIDSARFQNPPGGGGSIVLGATHDLTLYLHGGGTFGWDSLTARGGTVNLPSGEGGVTFDFSNSSSASFHAGTGGINAQGVSFLGPLLTLTSDGDITIGSAEIPVVGGSRTIQGTITAARDFTATNGNVTTGDLTAGGGIGVAGDLVVVNANAGLRIDVGGSLSASGSVNADFGGITADRVAVRELSANNLGFLDVGSGGIHPFVESISGGGGGAALQHHFYVTSIYSPNGIDFSGNQFGGIDGLASGGKLTIDASNLDFGTDGIGSVNFNGADAHAFNGTDPANGGDGGIFIVNTSGDISTSAGTRIFATTGYVDTNIGVYSGTGGRVELNSSDGAISINSTILVSSNDFGNDGPSGIRQFRESAAGGDIAITSGKTSGVAISIGSNSALNGALLSLLSAAAPGPGGSITILASNSTSNIDNSSEIDINGYIEADRGLVDIRHRGDAGSIDVTTPTISADVLKIAALGPDGVLNIGGGLLSADTTLKLYAPSSNGQINFVSNVTLGGNAAKILAANSVTIFDNVVVTITGPAPADVYTNHANYTGYGGNETTTGTFAGQGAHNPQPLSSAPPFDNSSNASSANRTRTATNTRPGGGHGIRVDNSTQLIALLDASSTGPNGRAIVEPRAGRNSNNVNSRSTDRRAIVSADHVAMKNGQRFGGVQLR